jgi:hypothetical protein
MACRCVTYLSDTGAPTIVVPLRPATGGKQGSRDGGIVDQHTVHISHPRVGKHITFDGRFLHGVPAR